MKLKITENENVIYNGELYEAVADDYSTANHACKFCAFDVPVCLVVPCTSFGRKDGVGVHFVKAVTRTS